ncbi:MAG: type II secretion system F family protein [Bauldia sp.]|nr:type II secretion system F family protein [Bauldia sp.]
MIDTIYETVGNPQFLVALLAGVATIAAIVTLTMPLLQRDKLALRMRSVALEREKIRQRERARMAAEVARPTIRQQAKPFMQSIVDRFNLRNALADENTVAALRMAGYRGQAPLVVFLFARVTLPIAFFAVAAFYIFGLGILSTQPPMIKWAIVLGAAYLGFYMPTILVKNRVQKRQTSIKRAWPDALDLMLICVESGISIEAAFRKVSEEIGSRSEYLAEELTLTTAELSYLSERRQAYENLGSRTGLDGIKTVMTSLIQAERYGTPIATTLRVMAQENRDIRMTEAEKKAAALPPKLTVPMIVFFLPVLFAVILGPAAIQLMSQ